MVVKRQFGTSWNVLASEDSDPWFSSHPPFLRLAVGATAVVDKPSVVGLSSGVDDQTSIQRQHVEVIVVLRVSLLEPLTAHGLIQYLTHILDDEIPDIQIRGCLQTPPPVAGENRLCLGILALLHALVLTQLANGTVLGVALDVYGSVNAGGVLLTRVLRGALAREEVRGLWVQGRAGHKVLVGLQQKEKHNNGVTIMNPQRDALVLSKSVYPQGHSYLVSLLVLRIP